MTGPILPNVLLGIVLFLAGVAVVMHASRRNRERLVEAQWRILAQPLGSRFFDPSMTNELPEPARRYLRHSMQAGIPLAKSVTLEIRGSIRLSRNGADMTMRSEELLAPPHGYIWRARVRRGFLAMQGFDFLANGIAEMRWWLWGLLPIVRAGGPDLQRSALGRLLGETAFLPSALLPSDWVQWEAVDSRTARILLEARGETTRATIRIDADGRLEGIRFPRWNNDPRIGPIGYMDFACDSFAAEQTFAGFTIPTRYRAGWRLGEPDEFPFFFAHIVRAEFR